MNCPYCQTNIKNKDEATFCKACGTGHHKDCWKENGGCAVYGCEENPTFSKSATVDIFTPEQSTVNDLAEDQIDVGNMSVSDLKNLLTKECIHCGVKIEQNSVYCRFCGKSQNEPKETTTNFEEEFKNNYKQKVREKRRRIIPLIISITVIAVLMGVVVISVIKSLDSYFNSDEYKVRVFISNWKKAWESKDLNLYKSFLDKDYKFIQKSGTAINAEERISRVENSYKTYHTINIKISDLQITLDSINSIYANVIFNQNYTAKKFLTEEVFKESGNKTLRLYRGKENNFEWKVFREYAE